MARVAELFQKYWFLLGLVVTISLGMWLGIRVAPENVDAGLSWIKSRWATALVLLLMSFTLNSQQLIQSFRYPWPVLWAVAVNYGLLPLMALLLLPMQQLDDFRIGLMLAASVPCTMAAASVWTRKGGGNDAVSLLVTVVTNGLCFVITPLWLNSVLHSRVELDLSDMVMRLVLAVLIPLLIGQSLRLIPAAAGMATRHKTPLGVAAQSIILALVLVSACKAGQRIAAGGPRPDTIATIVVWGSCIGLHLAAMFAAVLGGRLFGFVPKDLVAVAFASSQKTLPIGVLLADLVADVAPFAVFPMLMFHASQLFIDTVIAARFAASMSD